MFDQHRCSEQRTTQYGAYAYMAKGQVLLGYVFRGVECRLFVSRAVRLTVTANGGWPPPFSKKLDGLGNLRMPLTLVLDGLVMILVEEQGVPEFPREWRADLNEDFFGGQGRARRAWHNAAISIPTRPPGVGCCGKGARKSILTLFGNPHVTPALLPDQWGLPTDSPSLVSPSADD